MKIRPLTEHFYSIGWGRKDLQANLQMLSFYSTRHQPFIKQVHSAALTTILLMTKEPYLYFRKAIRKHNNTENGIF